MTFVETPFGPLPLADMAPGHGPIRIGDKLHVVPPPVKQQQRDPYCVLCLFSHPFDTECRDPHIP